MEPNSIILLLQVVNIVLLSTHIVLIILAFRRMRLYQTIKTQRLIWSLLILFVPLFGAIAFLFTHPQFTKGGQESSRA